MSSKQNGDRRMKGGSRKPRRKDPPAASRRVRDPEETPPDLDRQVIAGRIAEGESSNRNPISSLRDGGIRKSDSDSSSRPRRCVRRSPDDRDRAESPRGHGLDGTPRGDPFSAVFESLPSCDGRRFVSNS